MVAPVTLSTRSSYRIRLLREQHRNTVSVLSSAEGRDVILNRVPATAVAGDIIWALSSTDDGDVIINTLTSAPIASGIRGRPEVRLLSAPNPAPSGNNSKRIYGATATAVVGDIDVNVSKNDIDEIDDNVEYVMSVLSQCSVEKFDSGASRCMSGDPSRSVTTLPTDNRVRIVGFNNSHSEPSLCGLNADNKEEYNVSDMPSNLTLLCANTYCQDGCAVLFADDGLVLRMSESEL